jgi:hypothetical protein
MAELLDESQRARQSDAGRLSSTYQLEVEFVVGGVTFEECVVRALLVLGIDDVMADAAPSVRM